MGTANIKKKPSAIEYERSDLDVQIAYLCARKICPAENVSGTRVGRAFEAIRASHPIVHAAPDLLAYARLEADYSRLSNRNVPNYTAEPLMKWASENGCLPVEPIGLWLGRVRDAAIALAEPA